MKSTGKIVSGVLLIMFVSGCASIKPQAGFDAVSKDVKQRIGNKVHWYTGSIEDSKVRQTIESHLDKPLTVASAIEIALLNYEGLQAQYAGLGVSQADMVQAGLLRNPLLEITRLKPREDGANSGREISVRFPFLDIFLIPLRKKVAAGEFIAARKQVTATILDHAADVRKAFYAIQTAQHMEAMSDEIMASTAAALETATRLHKIGNITDAAYHSFRLSHDEARLAFAESQLITRAARENLGHMMGIRQTNKDWSIQGGLQPIPLQPVDLSDIEKRAIDNSLELAMLTHQIKATAQRAGIENVTSIINDLEAGYIWDKEPSGEWKDGPTLEFHIPVFDTGKARRERVKRELQKIKATYRVTEHLIQSKARLLSDRLKTSRMIVEHYIDNILPLNRSIKDYQLLNYNAMQIDVFALLASHEKQVAARQRFVQALHQYWVARADLETLLSGRTPAQARITTSAVPQGGADEGGH